MSSLSQCHSIIRTWEIYAMIESFWKGASSSYISLAPRNKSNGLIWFRGRLFHFLFLFTRIPGIPLSHFFLCVCLGNASTVINYIYSPWKKKKKRSTYSFLKYLTNILMTTCSNGAQFFSTSVIYCRKFSAAQPTCLHIVCVLSSSSSSRGLGQGG
jgi:hypothetical protein